jgi:hypothetical protein
VRGVLLLAIVVALLAASAAAASTPTQYRAKVNGICRGYTPKLKSLQTAMQKAEKAKDNTALGIALGKFLVYGLAQDVQVEAQPVPAALRARMAPILTLMRTIDSHVRAAIRDAEAGNGAGLSAELTKITTLAKPLNAKLDAAGLRDCGSNQS